MVQILEWIHSRSRKHQHQRRGPLLPPGFPELALREKNQSRQESARLQHTNHRKSILTLWKLAFSNLFYIVHFGITFEGSSSFLVICQISMLVAIHFWHGGPKIKICSMLQDWTKYYSLRGKPPLLFPHRHHSCSGLTHQRMAFQSDWTEEVAGLGSWGLVGYADVHYRFSSRNEEKGDTCFFWIDSRF